MPLKRTVFSSPTWLGLSLTPTAAAAASRDGPTVAASSVVSFPGAAQVESLLDQIKCGLLLRDTVLI